MMDTLSTIQGYPLRQRRFKISVDLLALLVVITVAAAIASNGWTILSCLDRLDRTLMVLLNFTGSARTDHFWYRFSTLGVWLPLAAVVVCDCMKDAPAGVRNKLFFLVAVALLITVLDQTTSGIIKPLVGRLRPSHDPYISGMLHYVNGYKGGRYGFVSSHAANVTGLTTWLFLTYRNKLTRAVLVIFTLMMCYSRIYLGVHYPGDVLCGALLGFVTAAATHRLLGRPLRLYVSDAVHYNIPIVFAATITVILITA